MKVSKVAVAFALVVSAAPALASIPKFEIKSTLDYPKSCTMTIVDGNESGIYQTQLNTQDSVKKARLDFRSNYPAKVNFKTTIEFDDFGPFERSAALNGVGLMAYDERDSRHITIRDKGSDNHQTVNIVGNGGANVFGFYPFVTAPLVTAGVAQTTTSIEAYCSDI